MIVIKIAIMYIFVLSCWCGAWCGEKRFYARETIRGLRISRLAEIPPLFSWSANMIELRKRLII